MTTRSQIVLTAVLRVVKPLARMLLRHGVAYPAFAAALKQVFAQAALEELRDGGGKQTDSAVSLLSGVHRRDLRNMVRGETLRPEPMTGLNMASEVVARWLSELEYLDEEGAPRRLARTGPSPSFDALVESISRDVRPRAVLDELVRMGIAAEAGADVHLLAPGFVPRQGFEEMADLMWQNLHDHAAAATLNLEGSNYLEQALFVDELTADSVARLHALSAQAWRQALKTVMREARARYDHDQAHASAEQRVHRVRFGSYFYASDNHDRPS